MLISIVTPVRNGARTIERTLGSLAAQKADFEHIVMDGGSSDATESIVRGYEGKYPVRWFSQPDRSIYEGWWNGFERSRGEILGAISADDFYFDWTLAVVRRIFELDPAIQWITGIPSWYFEDTGLAVTSTYAPVYLRSMIRGGWHSSARLGFLQQESMFWRRSLWEKTKPTAERLLKTYRYAADFYLWREFARHAELRTVGAVLACFTFSAGQASHQHRKVYLEECGLPERSSRNPAWGRALSRLIASACFAKVIRPCPVAR